MRHQLSQKREREQRGKRDTKDRRGIRDNSSTRVDTKERTREKITVDTRARMFSSHGIRDTAQITKVATKDRTTHGTKAKGKTPTPTRTLRTPLWHQHRQTRKAKAAQTRRQFM